MRLVLISLVTLHLKNKLDTPCKIIQKFDNNIRTKQKKKKNGKMLKLHTNEKQTCNRQRRIQNPFKHLRWSVLQKKS